MLQITKIFHFEMAHAIHGYPGPCKNIHGHSYELHVTVCTEAVHEEHIPGPGFLIDFKEIKKIVSVNIIDAFDHKLVLSRNFLQQNPYFSKTENLVVWEAEPTAENMLLFMKQALPEKFPAGIVLSRLKLYETKDSYAEWAGTNY